MAIICELCDSSNVAKIDGMFVCQDCGCKYTVEEAKALLNRQREAPSQAAGQSDRRLGSLVSNCVQAYKDGRYAKVTELADQIMDIEPQNAVAIIYHGLSIFQLYNKNPDDIKQAESLIKRGLEIIKDRDDSDELFYICMADLTDVYCKMSNEYLEAYNANIESWKEYTRQAAKIQLQLGTDLLLLGTNDVRVMRMNNEIESLQQKASVYEEAYKNAQSMALNLAVTYDQIIIVYEKVLRSKKYFDIKVYEKLEKIPASFWGGSKENNEIILKHLNNITNGAKNIGAEYRRTVLKAEKEKKKEEYWTQHQEEKARLENEKAELKIREASLQGQIDEIDKANKPALDKLYDEREKDVPSQVEYSKLQEEIRSLESRRMSLGIFKGKEKKEISEKIEELRTKQNEVYKEIEIQQKQRNKDINSKIQEIKSQGAEQRKELSEVRSRISQIDNEFAMDR